MYSDDIPIRPKGKISGFTSSESLDANGHPCLLHIQSPVGASGWAHCLFTVPCVRPDTSRVWPYTAPEHRIQEVSLLSTT